MHQDLGQALSGKRRARFGHRLTALGQLSLSQAEFVHPVAQAEGERAESARLPDEQRRSLRHRPPSFGERVPISKREGTLDNVRRRTHPTHGERSKILHRSQGPCAREERRGIEKTANFFLLTAEKQSGLSPGGLAGEGYAAASLSRLESRGGRGSDRIP